jgi:hypothetical protein
MELDNYKTLMGSNENSEVMGSKSMVKREIILTVGKEFHNLYAA